MKALVLCGGGVDSTTVAHVLSSLEYEVDLIHIDYGQRSAARERRSAIRCAIRLSGQLLWLDIPVLGGLLTSALTNTKVEIPTGEYTPESLAVTVVPNRNAILANIAVGVAAAQGHDVVGLGIHAGDHAIYSDCRPAFFYALQDLAYRALGDEGPKLLAPFLTMKKWQIVAIGAELRVPYELTWSCYDGGVFQCGQCSTCMERRQAFKLACIPDPTTYGG